ncbi:hypothetical protein RNJ44_02935 [Nakaseomyces bracarensis]|uniref:Sfi1 spindle body domain-containing protein n=1 Tax=Nakaseomyces bracarensis TaxID=273131 RepID=A0ABR4P0M6_9SACH
MMDSPSTEMLLNGDFDAATQSLINGAVPELMDKVHVSTSPYLEVVRSPEDITSRSRETHTRDLSTVMSILEPLFERVRDFLEVNELSPSFLKVFAGYIRILMENELDPLADEYLLCVQNELGRSLVLSKSMEDILTWFLVKPANTYIAMALFEYRRDKLIELGTFKHLLLILKLITRENHLLSTSNRYLESNYLSLWRSSYNKKAEVWAEKANRFNGIRIKILGYDRWMEKKEVNEKRQKLADDYFTDKALKRFHKSYRSLLECEQKFKVGQDKLLASTALKIWKIRTRENSFSLRNKHLLELHFSFMKKKLRKIKTAYTISNRSRDEFLLRRGLRQLAQRYDYRKQYEIELEQRELTYAKRKALEFMVTNYKNQLLMDKAVSHDRMNLLKSYFAKVWSTRYEERLKLYQYQIDSESRLVHNVFQKWIKQMKLKIIDASLLRSQGGNRYLQVWRLKTKEKKTIYERNKRLLDDYLLKWHSLSLLKSREREFALRKCFQRYILNWKAKTDRNAMDNDKAYKMRQTWLVSRSWERFLNKFGEINNMRENANSYVKLKHYKILIDKAHSNKSLELLLQKELNKKLSKIQMKQSFNLWKKAIEKRKDMKLEIIEEEFNVLHAQHLMEKYFRVFLFAMYSAEADKTYARSLQLKCYLAIADKVDSLKEQGRVCAQSLNTSRMKKIFSLWKRKRLKIANLERLYLDTSNGFTARGKQELFSLWYNKIKFDDTMVQKIQLRWSRALLRGCLQAWKEKRESNPKLRTNSEMYKTPAKNEKNISENNQVKNSPTSRNVIRRAKLVASPIKGSSVLESVLRKRVQQNNSFISDAKTETESLESGISRLNFIDIPQLPPSEARLKGSPTRRKNP